MAKAMQIKVGNPLRKLVLLKLADNASDQGECWPSYQYIADQCEISKRSVMNHINDLCKSGLLKKVVRKGVKANRTNVYVLTLDGAGDSPGGGRRFTRVVQELHQGSAGVAPGGSAGAAPRISHSFEPVNEPVIDHGASARADDHSRQAKINSIPVSGLNPDGIPEPAKPEEKINFQSILDAYHELLPEMPRVKILTDARKKHIRTFWKKYQFNDERWRAYLGYIAMNCRWMLEDRPNGHGGFWKRKNLDYLIAERCYVAVKEERANDQ
ncbi:Putative replication protein [Escherichia coli]|nr:Putative replication protein [Escherichia coli]CAD6098724.1 Putative replication protein [Escherichia coli]CAD6176567.1 Putative replication protein [Escherichia coli]